jgi:ABC-type sulfate transport system permease subunit
MPGAFAVASILTLLALVTLGVKVILERRARREMELAKQMRETGTPV